MLIQCDLGNRKSTAETLAEISKKYKVNAIVNNVGIAIPEPIESLSLDSLDMVYDLNVRVATQTCQAFVPQMKHSNYGRIVNVTSRAIFGAKNRTSYAAAKSAMIGCTKTWALELAHYGITVNAIAPGPIETELFRKSRPVGSNQEKEIIATIPMKRIGTAKEIAQGIEFLLYNWTNIMY